QSRDNPMLRDMTLRLPRERLDERQALRRQLDAFDRALDTTGMAQAMDGFQQQAVNVLLGRAREALDLAREPAVVRERYGGGGGRGRRRARGGAGGGAASAPPTGRCGASPGGPPAGPTRLAPPLDHAVAAFAEDVRARGLEEDILLVVTGEFGRTPRINGG